MSPFSTDPSVTRCDENKAAWKKNKVENKLNEMRSWTSWEVMEIGVG